MKYLRLPAVGSPVRHTTLAFAALLAGCMPPSWGAAALLHPARRPVAGAPALPHRDFTVVSDGATLRGWIFPARSQARSAAVLYLHGAGDNRESGVWIAERLVRAGHDVVLYDGRAHGESTGDACTYGFYEKRDLSRVLDGLGIDRAVVIGVSLGAAVALQAAAEDPRIVAAVAVATFSDLEAVARERAPWFASEGQIREALAIAQREGRFELGEVSPARAARRIHVPVLLVHGARDVETRPVHSERVFAALAGPRRLSMVEGAGHGDALVRAWPEVEAWMARAVPPVAQR
jgi:pimeloyl-ACP methyl ester carboxylesterase